MVDFSNCDVKLKGYGGANGTKLCIEHKGEMYMLKFPSNANKNANLSYANSCVSEHLGCEIFRSVQIPAQETILGYYKNKVVVACKDFTKPGIVLQDFASMKNQIIDSERNGYGTELSDIEHTIDNQFALDPTLLLKFFWDVFIVDAFIGNWDRHNGNWGFLYNSYEDTISLAPVFDCGSSLYPQADLALIEKILQSPGELNTRIYNRPLAAITVNRARINYYDFISSLQNQDCNDALIRMLPKFNLDNIKQIIDSIECINELQKEFYYTMLVERKKKILDYSLKKLLSQSKELTCDLKGF